MICGYGRFCAATFCGWRPQGRCHVRGEMRGGGGGGEGGRESGGTSIEVGGVFVPLHPPLKKK